MALRRTRARFVRPPARTSIWLGFNLGPIVVPANSAILAGSLDAAALALRPFTIIRTHLVIRWVTDQAAVAEFPHGAFGSMVVTDQATAIGVTAVPDPISDPDADWYFYHGLTVEMIFLSSVGFESDAGHTYLIDSKAMRKVGPNQDIVDVVSNQHATHGAVLTVQGRQLIKLH